MADRLGSYRSKRDFATTPEPGGDAVAPDQDAGGTRVGRRGTQRRRDTPAARFVIQQHDATRLHWDLRIEHDGALACWAIPNGIPPTPGENRLAVRTEDHPLEYLDFEGEIPKGQYGAGTMTIWDRGSCSCERFDERKVIVELRGERVQGRYALFPIAPPSDWMIHRMDPPSDPDYEGLPERLVPMLARAGPLPADDAAYAYEIKWDGIRALLYAQPGRVRLQNRNLRDVTATYPELRQISRALGSHAALLDGEIVAFDDNGQPSFERLQQRMHVASERAVRQRMRTIPVVYVAFDLLHLDGHSLMSVPYDQRRAQLEKLALQGPCWQTPAAHRGSGAALLDASRRAGLEGIVAKRRNSPYEPGLRTGAWIKVKNVARQEAVIGGWLPGEGHRNQLGALLVGVYEAMDAARGQRLRYVGRVGTGFSDAQLAELTRRLRALERPQSPFAVGAVPKGARYVEPRLVAELEFRSWTTGGILRHTTYLGLRDDRDPISVVREPTTAEREDNVQPDQHPGGDRDHQSRRPGRGEATKPPGRGDATKRPGRGEAAVIPPLEGSPGIERITRTRGGGVELTVEGCTLRISNYDKVLYPATGFTKGDLAAYHAAIAPTLLPHLRDRPLTLKRYPNGVQGAHFYEKQCPRHRPDWVQTTAVRTSRAARDQIDYCLAQDLPTLIWLANLADIELHTSLSLAGAPDRPTMLVFDLDPGAPATIVECARVALLLSGMLAELGLECLPKTSGSKGLQVYVPLNGPISYDETKPFALAVAETLERTLPELVVTRMAKRLRPGKVLVDWSQNDAHKTTVSVYSLRAVERPAVSTPLHWEEVRDAVRHEDPQRLVFDPATALDRVRRDGDLFAPLLSMRQRLPGDRAIAGRAGLASKR